MSDRIDELGKQILDEFAIADVDPAVFSRVGALTVELATIAREAVKWRKVAEWLAMHDSQERKVGGMRIVEYPLFLESHAIERIAAALAAVEGGRDGE